MNIRSPWVAACLLGLIAAVCAKPQPSEGFSDPEKQPGDRSGYTERPHDGEKWTGAPDVSERPPMGAGQPPAGADRPAIPPGMAGGLSPRDSSDEPPRNKFTGTWKPRDYTGTPRPHGAMGGMRGHGILNGQRPNGKSHEEFTGSHHSGEFTKMPEAKPQGTWSPENAPSGDQFGRQGGPGGARSKRDIVGGVEHP